VFAAGAVIALSASDVARAAVINTQFFANMLNATDSFGSANFFAGGAALAAIGATGSTVIITDCVAADNIVVADRSSAVGTLTAGGCFTVWTLETSQQASIDFGAVSTIFHRNTVSARQVDAMYVRAGGGALILYTEFASMTVLLDDCTLTSNTADLTGAGFSSRDTLTGGGGLLLGNLQVCANGDQCVNIFDCAFVHNSVHSSNVGGRTVVAGGGGLLSATESQILVRNTTMSFNTGTRAPSLFWSFFVF
jgi:hypothetical protein